MLAALCSCMGNARYTVFCPIGPKGWRQTDTLTYAIDTLDINDECEIQLLLHTESYPYTNITLHMTARQDTLVVVDTIATYDLARESSTKGMGHRYDFLLSIGKITLCDSFPTTIHLTHRMTDTLLKGVRQVGIEIREQKMESDEIVWHVAW